MANNTPKKICQYKELCEKHKMSSKNVLIKNVLTRWNSTYDMIIAAWEKKEGVEYDGNNLSERW